MNRLTGLVLALSSVILAACADQSPPGFPDEPIPLPDPAAYQNHQGPYRTERVEVVLQPTERTEVKAVMAKDQVILYEWMANVPVYADFHGHDPNDDSYWYRYREQEAGFSSSGSLVAPVAGEHGWFFRNDSNQEIVINLRISGYYENVRNLGIFPPAATADSAGN